jgi:sugar phosphate isomerase/epimerase
MTFNADNGKMVLTRISAGPETLEKFDMQCEHVVDWADPLTDRCAERIASSHAPLLVRYNGGARRLNIASPDREYRALSLAILEDYIRGAACAPNITTIVTHSAPRFWPEDAGVPCEVRQVGRYELLIEGFKRLSRAAEGMGLRLVVENNRVPWNDVAEDEDYDPEIHFGKARQYFATTPEEWARAARDVDEPAFGLCLDTSHATTYAHRLAPSERMGVFDRFLDAGGEDLWHVHWNDNLPDAKRGRGDMHLPLGRGTIPLSVHRRVWRHPSVRLLLLERWLDEETLAEELRFIEQL